MVHVFQQVNFQFETSFLYRIEIRNSKKKKHYNQIENKNHRKNHLFRFLLEIKFILSLN